MRLFREERTKLKKLWPSKQLAGYISVVFAAAVVAIFAGWTGFASRIDNYAYDFFFGLYPPHVEARESALVAIDENTLNEFGGMRRIRSILAATLDRLATAPPKAVALDVILADPGDPAEDAKLEAAMARTHDLVLPCELVPGGWENPIPRFSRHAVALGHIHADDKARDGVSRQIQLEKLAPGDRRWALSLVAFQYSRGGQPIMESPEDLEIAGVRIPAARRAGERPLRIRFAPDTAGISAADLLHDPSVAAELKGKTVFVGVTALTAARDRLITPLGESVPGVAVHRDAFETIAQGQFLTPASNLTVLAVCFAFAAAAGFTFWYRGGWSAYVIGAGLLGVAHTVPAYLFRQGLVFPYFAAVSAAWLPVAAAATYRYFVVRGQLHQSESDKARYRQAIHFVTHEMRTPLTAIQGSSELMGRYVMSEDKRKQIALMINSESKRLARMIQTFLDVERLTEGQTDLKKEQFGVEDLMATCLARVIPIAERKQIQIHPPEPTTDVLTGDRELMEYAVYNLLTNAVKYSEAGTEAWLSGERSGGWVRISVRDQGIGIDAKEIKNVFTKFYRTKKAEASGESGTGIGLSIVDQIVKEHGGRMEVASRPGQGSTFTMILPCHAEAPVDALSASKRM